MFATLRTVSLGVFLSASLVAQAASSPTFFLAGGEFSAGGNTLSAKYTLTGNCGSGVVAQRTTSTGFELVGGFVAASDTPLFGRPWITGVRPLRVVRNSDVPLVVHGTELHLGTSAAVQFGGRTATVTTRSRDKIRAVLPRGVAPGWQQVRVTAGGATAALSQAVAVLPLVETEQPAVPGSPFRITFRGTRGDAVIWLLAPAKLPFRAPVAPYGYGLGLDLTTVLVVGVSPVTDPRGRFDLPLPGVPWSRPLHVQALALSSNPAYRPGSFTNVIGL